MTEHKELIRAITKKKSALAKQQAEAIAVADYCVAEIKRLEECEKLLNNGTEASVTGMKIA